VLLDTCRSSAGLGTQATVGQTMPQIFLCFSACGKPTGTLSNATSVSLFDWCHCGVAGSCAISWTRYQTVCFVD
jgi:hypothetical protein